MARCNGSQISADCQQKLFSSEHNTIGKTEKRVQASRASVLGVTSINRHTLFYTITTVEHKLAPRVVHQNFASSLRKKCPYSEFFWSALSRIRTEYGEIQSITQNNSEYGHFSRSARNNRRHSGSQYI